jgi:hypothetical protein
MQQLAIPPVCSGTHKKEIKMSVAINASLPTTFSAVSSVEPQVVVLNDTPTSEQTAQATKSTIAFMEQLVIEHEVWQQNAFRTSNDQLYALLQKCYQIYKSMEGNSPEAAALRNGLKDYIAIKGFTFKSSTHTLTKIVSCVFGIDRRRVSNYSIVLRNALSKGIHVQDIAEYIRNEGGVEEIRLQKSPNAMTAKQKAQIATNTVVVNNIGVVQSTALAEYFDAGKIGAHTVLIGTWQADGTVVVRAVVKSESVLNAALSSHYTTIKAAANAQAIENAVASLAEAKQAAIESAVASATVTI